MWLRRKLITAAQIPMYTLSEFQRLEPEQLVLVGKNRALAVARPDQLLFIDTETNGLAGGTGTFAFLIGIARVTPEGVEVCQYFLGDAGEELALLTSLLDEMASAAGLVSYNGKSYDLPLLRNRCILNRLPVTWEGRPHLDLLHAARRLFRSLPSYTLSQVEAEILGFRRDGDIPGALIPGLYFEAVRCGDVGPLEPVFKHNVMDLLTLIGITAAAAARFSSFISATKEAQSATAAPLSAAAATVTPADLLAVAQTFAELELYDAAIAAYTSSTADKGGEAWSMLRRHHSRLLKSRGEAAAAAALWSEWIDRAHRFDPEPYEELAKHLEHRTGDLAAALRIVEQAEKRVEILQQLRVSSGLEETAAALERRRLRLQRKIANSAPGRPR